MNKEITTWGFYAQKWVSVNGERIAMMERSPFTGEWCYGERTAYLGKYGEPTYRPPFKSTYFKTAKAAAKFVAKELGHV